MFDEFAGNDRVKAQLRRMLESGRVPGALLFSGEEGVGKKHFAVELARALNCNDRKGVEACGKCRICRRIGDFNFPQSEEAKDWEPMIRANHADVGLMVAPRRVLKVEQMREIEREANYRPFEGRARVFLIDDADQLNDASSNALLKILEEPPSTTHIILITSRPAMLLPTIHSRCQAVRFSPLSNEELEQHLINNKLANRADAKLLARCAGGSIGRAVRGDLESFKEHRKPMLEVLSALALSGDRTKLLRVSELLNDARFKNDFEFRLELLETLIRDAMVLVVGAPESQVVNEDLLPELRRIAERISSAQAIEWITQIEELREQLEVNINRKVAADALFLSMASQAGR